MKHNYTKQQIAEAIKHWESVLKRMNESENSLHKALYSLFGDRLYDPADRCALNVQLIKDVFDVFNAELFDNVLQSLDPLVLSTGGIQDLFNRYQHNEDPNNMYALYMPIPDWKAMEDNDMKTILNAEFFILNSTTCKNASTSFIVNAICHEMIHQYDTWFGDILKIVLNSSRNKSLFNEHLTKIFQDKSQEANNMSLTIFPDAAGIPIDKLNSLSAMRLSRKKPLNEIDSIEQLENELIGPGRMNHFKSHMVATDLGDGRFAISFWYISDKDKMKEANDNGINVVSELSSDDSHIYDNTKARFILKQVIGEAENPNVEILQSKHDLFMHNKKTGYGFFTHFD